MHMKRIALSASLLASIVCTAPAFCQASGHVYHHKYSHSRAVSQRDLSYSAPGQTADLSPGTPSASAQGINQVGERINPLLPKVPWGSTISTGGDQQYRSGFQTGDLKGVAVPSVPGTAITNRRLPGCNWGGNTGTAGDAIRSDMHPEVNINNERWWHPQALTASRPSTVPVTYEEYTKYADTVTATYEDPQQQNTGGLSY